jgi:hypothetical protein
MHGKPRTLYALLMILALLLSTTGSAAAARPPKKAAWTVMVYISGDNNLEEYVVLDIETELAISGSSKEVQVLALADRIPGYDDSRGDWTNTLLFRVTKDMLATPENAIADWGERSMGDPQTLLEFVTWTKANYPADHYALYLWGHGWGWRTSFTMRDETDDNDSLDPHELMAIMPALGPIDVVAYDGCNMAAIEVQALWHGTAVATVHSQEWVGWDGIEYDVVLEGLHANPAMTPDEVAILTNQSAGLNRERTGSAVATDARWVALLTAVDEWAVALEAGLPTYRTRYDRAFRPAQDFWGDPSAVDLYDAAARIQAIVPDAAIQAASQAVVAAVQAVVLDEWHAQQYREAHGISIFLPTHARDLDHPDTPENDLEYYRTLPFASRTHWDEFLVAYQMP